MPRSVSREAELIDELVMGMPKTGSARVRELLDLGLRDEALRAIDSLPYDEVVKLAEAFKVAEDTSSQSYEESPQPVTAPPPEGNAPKQSAPPVGQPGEPEEPAENIPPSPEGNQGIVQPKTEAGPKTSSIRKRAQEACDSKGSGTPEEPEKEENKPEEPKPEEVVDAAAPALDENGSPTDEAQKAARLGYVAGLAEMSREILARAAARRSDRTKVAADQKQAAVNRLLNALL